MTRTLLAVALGGFCLAALLSVTSEVLAQEGAAPPASRGFQLALRTGYSLPMGKATGEDGDDLSKGLGNQIPFLVDLGGKLTDNIFLGGYIGAAVGKEGSDLEKLCGTSGISCTTAAFRIGALFEYNFLPNQKVNPWLGYGIGIESNAINAEGNGRKASVTITGFEFAHLMGGVDFRLTELFGIGPFVDLSIGQFDRVTNDDGSSKETTTIDKKAMHQWLTLGVRAVFWP